MYSENVWQSGDIITADKMNNINEGINEASVHPLDKITTGTETSCDKYTTAGVYWLSKNTVTDTPNGGSGILTVITNSSKATMMQLFTSFNTDDGYFAIRVYANSKWYGWDQRPASADYVTEQGTSGDWKYRIWNSGLKECWYMKNVTNKITNSNGGIYFSDPVEVAYPFSFSARPTLYVGMRSLNSRPFWAIPAMPSSGEDPKTSAYYMALATASTSTLTTHVYLYACGK